MSKMGVQAAKISTGPKSYKFKLQTYLQITQFSILQMPLRYSMQNLVDYLLSHRKI